MDKIVNILSLIAMVFTTTTTLAHSEHDKSRFVSAQGQDTGRCDNVLRPCKTIAYAVQQANKGDKILVGAGKYPINSTNELFYLKSEIVPVLGGYNRFDHFQSQSPDTNITTLVGVPTELVNSLRMKGFAAISDGKSLSQNKMLDKKLRAYNTLSKKQANQACVNNLAGEFACNNIDLLAHMPLSSFSSKPTAGNDIWGHVDLNTGDEYAIIGLNNGVAVVNISDPSNPTEVGTITGKNDIWRDIKVYQYFDQELNLWRSYAYATIDGSSDYVTVIDLNHLPNNISLIQKNKAVAQAHNVYITNVDHTLNIALAGMTPTLQLIGANKYSGAFHSYSLDNPENITLLSGNSAGSGYTHDGASLLITDNRKTTDCQTTQGNCSVFIDFNEKEMKLWNISNASETTLLGTAEYNDVDKANQYIHSGWGTEDKQFILLHDEFDEFRGGLNSTVRIFSISDLTNPQQVGQWTGPTKAIDHNGFVRGNRYYMSNYERGLTVLDITDPTQPVEIGYFDTFTPANSASFNGAWGTYPFLPSGNILISDINSGLYILKDNTLTNEQGNLSFSTTAIDTAQGTTLAINVTRNATSNTATSVSVAYEIIPGSAKENQDYTPNTGILYWVNNNTDNQQINIAIAADPNGEEYEESFYVRLFDPKNGATVSSPSYITVNIAGKIDHGAASFTQSTLLISENQGAATINIARDGSTKGELSVNYQLQSGSAIAGQDIENTTGSFTWQDGDNSNKTITLNLINDSEEESNESFELILEAGINSRIGANAKITITISDDDSNTAPIVVIKENFQANTGQTVSLTATASDAENDALLYLWQQSSGTAVSLNNSNELSATFVAPANAEDLSFTLTVTDTKGLSTTKTVTVSIIKPAVTPTTPEPSKNSSGGSHNILLLLLATIVILRRKNALFA